MDQVIIVEGAMRRYTKIPRSQPLIYAITHAIIYSVGKAKLLQAILRNPRNGRFGDFCKAMEAVGFVLDRQKGSHRVYEHQGLKETMIVQPRKDGHAKPYQVRQFIALVTMHHLEVIEP